MGTSSVRLCFISRSCRVIPSCLAQWGQDPHPRRSLSSWTGRQFLLSRILLEPKPPRLSSVARGPLRFTYMGVSAARRECKTNPLGNHARFSTTDTHVDILLTCLRVSCVSARSQTTLKQDVLQQLTGQARDLFFKPLPELIRVRRCPHRLLPCCSRLQVRMLCFAGPVQHN